MLPAMHVPPFIFAVLCAVVCSAGAAEIQATGRVFIDHNGNGSPDPDDVGLPGVRVTDGVGFAVTGDDGSFSLVLRPDPVKRHGEPAVVAISCPSAYRPVGPWFVVLPQQPTPPVLQFALQPQAQPLPFTWVHGTDCHVPRAGEDKFRNFRRDLDARRGEWAFCVLGGDLVDLADSHPPLQAEAEFGLFQQETRDFPLPLFCIPGNHDIAGIRAKEGWTSEHPLYGYRGFTRVVGPLRWSFTHADVHFVGLDFNGWDGSAWTLGVPASAVEWLAEDLRQLTAGTRVFLFAHHLSNSAPLDAFLAGRPVDAVFTGHGHQDLRTEVHGIPVFEGGSLSQIFGKSGAPIGYRVIHVERDGFRTEYRATGAPQPASPGTPPQEG